MMKKAPFAIRKEDALSWHWATLLEAGLAQRADMRIRAFGSRWEVWATDSDFAAIQTQGRDE